MYYVSNILVTHTIVQESHNCVQCMRNVYITCDLQYLILFYNIVLVYVVLVISPTGSLADLLSHITFNEMYIGLL